MNLQQRDGSTRVMEGVDFNDVIKHELQNYTSTQEKLEALAYMFANLLSKSNLSTNEKLEIISYEWEEQ